MDATPESAQSSHRGILILLMGSLSLLGLFFFGAAAWSLANADLHGMETGRVDPRGEGITRAGRTLGKIGLGLALGVAAAFFLAAVLAWAALA